MKEKIIIHVDMDAFYAAIEVRDNPDLADMPLIIGALPSERGVVSTCSYEARKYGVRSAMSIKEAYRRCPHGVYMHPNMHKYKKVSGQIHEIWAQFTDLVEYLSLDEGYLDVTGSAHLFGGPVHIAQEIKKQTLAQVGVTCSVGIGYTMMSAKLASEEMKPDGYFEIRSAAALKKLIIGRNVRILSGVGAKTGELLEKAGIYTVGDIYKNRQLVLDLLGNQGKEVLLRADGVDSREVTPYAEAKSIGKEHTFQNDITDFSYLKDVLVLIARELSFEIHQKELYCTTVTLKVTYSNMQSITRSRTGAMTNLADDIYKVAASLMNKIEKRPIRLIGISLSNFSDTHIQQISLMELGANVKKENADKTAFLIQQRFGKDAIKTGNELKAEKRLEK